MELPKNYTTLTWQERKLVREEYIKKQNGMCYYCGSSLFENPPNKITSKPIKWKLFPPNFLKYPIHLQHDHESGMTEGVVHAYCNAVMWQYEQR